jgi:hypothetical protein
MISSIVYDKTFFTIKKNIIDSKYFYVINFYVVSMSVQEVIDIKQKKRHKKNLPFLEVNRHDNNVISYSKNFSEGNNKITSRNFKNLVNYEQTIKKTMEEIKYNFMEEHKKILNTIIQYILNN